MDATGAAQGGGSGGNAAKGSQATAAGNSAASAKLRKRTKTGCLTCRRRRIKCGEERPICNNCTKSKRSCEGYAQRLNWKQSGPDWGGLSDDAGPLQYGNGLIGGPSMDHYRPVPPPINTGGFMPMRMQQGQPYGYTDNGEPIFSPPHTGGPYMHNMHGMPMTSPQFPPAWTPMTPQYGQPMYGQPPMSAISPHSFPPNFSPAFQQPSSATIPSTTPATTHASDVPQFRQQSYSTEASLPSATIPPQYSAPGFAGSSASHIPLQANLVDDPALWDQNNGSIPQQQIVSDASWIQAAASNAESSSPNFSTPSHIIAPSPTAPFAAKYLGPSITGIGAQILEAAAVENHDDNYYDVESDEEMDDDMIGRASNQLSLVRQLAKVNLHELSQRRYDTFLYEGILDQYRPEEHANPLNNSNTARVYAHFISATGPSLAIFERHPKNPGALFNEHLPDNQKGIWTYTLPMKAIFNQGLLHAMLALASLHISKLQNTSDAPSLKHYGYAIKDIHKRVSNPKRKLLPTTIAATLLLGFYEILTADHMKWSSHLGGARELLQAVQFKQMAKEARVIKAQQLAQKDQFSFYETGIAPSMNDFSAALDENLISNLVGKQVKFEQFGQVFEDQDEEVGVQSYKKFDMEKYELYQDLYWWYARQDVYQAILSGNKLLLSYHKWTDCPPRASMGRPDAIFGTHDHLILLFARIADFSAKDRQRKIRVINANGGHWRPHPSMNMGPPPGMGAPPPGMGGPPSAMSGMPSGMSGPSPGNGYPQGMSQGMNPNASFMNAGQSSMAPQPLPQGFPPSNMPAGYGQQPPPNMNFPSSGMPHGLGGFPNGQPPAPFGGGGPPMQNPIGASPNFKQERAFSEASPNAPFSGQPPMGPPQTPNGMRRPSMGGPPPPPPPPAFYGMAPLPTQVNIPSSYQTDRTNATPSPKSEKGEIDPEVALQNALKEWGQLKAALNTYESHLGPHFKPLPADVNPEMMTPFGPALIYRSHDVGVLWAMYYMACIILERANPHMPPAAMVAAGVAAGQTVQYGNLIGRIVGGIVPPVLDTSISPNLGACLCECSLPLFFAGVIYQKPDQREWLITLLRTVEQCTGWKSIGMVAQGCETAWEKAFEMKRGPPYRRKFDQWHLDTMKDSRVARMTSNYTEMDADAASRLPTNVQGTRVHWAMGILGEKEDGDEKESRHISGVQPSKEPHGP